jgi:hypothetical protein
MGDTTTDTNAALWRLVLADGTVRCAHIVNGTRVVLDGAGETFVSWDAGDPEAVERYLLATAVRLGWRVREVVPPGERTREETARALRTATGERDEAARAVARLLEDVDRLRALSETEASATNEHADGQEREILRLRGELDAAREEMNEIRASMRPKPEDCALDLAAIEKRRERAGEVAAVEPEVLALYQDVPVLVGELRRVLDLFARERAVRLSYEEGITWETSCLNCASLLTQCRAQEERAEKAEAIVAGSTTLPTEPEIAAVDAAGGYWFIAFRGLCGASNAEGARSHVRGAAMGWWAPDEARWWPCVGGVIVARPSAAPAALEAL